MSSYIINGTSFNDDISVDNYYSLYPDGTSWEVYGHGGDDLLDYYFTGRALSGILSGGDGNDLLLLDPLSNWTIASQGYYLQ